MVLSYSKKMSSRLALGVGAFLLGTGASLTTIYYTQPKYIVRAASRINRYRAGLTTKSIINENGYKFSYAVRFAQGAPKGPPMLCVHGIGGDLDIWLAVAQHLPRDFDLILVDLPAHGKTDCDPQKDCSVTGLADRLKEFVALVGLDKKPFHITGQSLGGTVTTYFATRHSDNVCMVSLACPGMRTPEESEMVKYLKETEDVTFFSANTPDQLERTLQFCFNKPTGLPKQILQGLIDMKQHNKENVEKLFLSLADDMYLSNDEERNLTTHTKQIKVPTQILWGKDDMMIHVSGAAALKASLRNCQSVDIFNCGHSLNMVLPKEMAESIVKFRQSVLTRQK